MIRSIRMSKRQRNDAFFTFLLLLPAGIIMAVVTIYPLVRSFIISMLRWDLTKPNICS